MRSSTCQIQGTLDGGEDEKEDQQQDSTQHVELVVWEVSREALAQTERTPMVHSGDLWRGVHESDMQQVWTLDASLHGEDVLVQQVQAHVR